jgi:cellulose synthase (UDP-forming)
VLPLVGLTLITLLNLWGLATPAAHLDPIALAGRPIGVLWGGLNLISLLIALRACWDPPVSDPAPWQQITLAAWLDDNGGGRWPCTMEAISESGVELRLAEPLPPHLDSAQLHWVSGMAGLPVTLSLRRGQRLAMTWHNLNQQRRQALLLWLYGRPGCWPDRTAQQEWRALLVLISRIVKPAPAPAPLARSLMRQQLSSADCGYR